MRMILWMIYFWLYMLAVFVPTRYVLYLQKKGETEKADRLTTKLVQNWANRLLIAAGVKIIVRGEENLPDGPALFASNHQGYFDIPTMITRLGHKQHPIVAKKEIGNIPMVRTCMKMFHCIFMDRDDPRQSLRCLQEAQKLMEGGESVVIFPEGTRSKGEPLDEFKAGAFKPALKTGLPIVPVSVDGSYKAMEAHHMWIHPATIYLTILPPIETKGLPRERSAKIGEEVRERIYQGRLATRRELGLPLGMEEYAGPSADQVGKKEEPPKAETREDKDGNEDGKQNE